MERILSSGDYVGAVTVLQALHDRLSVPLTHGSPRDQAVRDWSTARQAFGSLLIALIGAQQASWCDGLLSENPALDVHAVIMACAWDGAIAEAADMSEFDADDSADAFDIDTFQPPARVEYRPSSYPPINPVQLALPMSLTRKDGRS